VCLGRAAVSNQNHGNEKLKIKNEKLKKKLSIINYQLSIVNY
jgi:hypothetical protein